jgi:hypothetical protein
MLTLGESWGCAEIFGEDAQGGRSTTQIRNSINLNDTKEKLSNYRELS